MIRIGNETLREEAAISRFNDDSIKLLILRKLMASEATHTFPSIDYLEFELDLRSKIVHASERLNNSHFDFAVFKKSRCNPEYWKRTEEGGFMQRPGTSAFKAVKDILANSRLYATECSTAIVIVFYLALTEKLSEELFNSLFDNLYLMNWKYLDKDLGMKSYTNIKETLPGDCLYFENPDYDPKTPEWQGENAIQLVNGKYYGHGVGIRTAEGMIRALNQKRKPGAAQSAYLSDLVVKPHYKYLFDRWKAVVEKRTPPRWYAQY